MEKLVKLLNEYEEKYNRSELYYKFELENWQLFCYDDVTDYLWTMQDEAMVICSKKFGFIQRLVNNDKIDLKKYKDKSELYTLKVVHWTDYYIDLLTNKVNSDFLLMLLAISDTPIEDLISYLK